jgi:hypothetical protein
MSEELLILHCSPTLAGLKTGNLFTCSYKERGDVPAFLRSWNISLRSKGVRLLPLRVKDGKALIYVYRPSLLHSVLRSDEVCSLLTQRGYCTDSCEKCVIQLMDRLGESAEFPHEIGLFLGYPPEDVCGFIENRACNCKCVGCWKVYGDEEAARKKFAQYKKCTQIYCDQWAKGKAIERLTVAC